MEFFKAHFESYLAIEQLVLLKQDSSYNQTFLSSKQKHKVLTDIQYVLSTPYSLHP